MPVIEVILFCWLALGVLGVAFALLLLLAVIVGGLRDLTNYWHERVEDDRRSHGLCTYCGYDLRHSHGRCPECGGATPTLSTLPLARI